MATHTCQWNLAPSWKNSVFDHIVIIFPDTSLTSNANKTQHPFQISAQETHWEERRRARRWGTWGKQEGDWREREKAPLLFFPGLHVQLLTSLFCSRLWEISERPGKESTDALSEVRSSRQLHLKTGSGRWPGCTEGTATGSCCRNATNRHQRGKHNVWSVPITFMWTHATGWKSFRQNGGLGKACDKSALPLLARGCYGNRNTL